MVEIINESQSINALNDDCLGIIFKKLGPMDRLYVEDVCKRWQRISCDSWSDIKDVSLTTCGLFRNEWSSQIKSFEEDYEFEVDKSRIAQIFNRSGRFWETLEITEFREIKNEEMRHQEILSQVNEYCCNLKKLYLTLQDCSQSLLHFSFLKFKKLEAIKINISNTDVDWQRILRNLPITIREISLMNNSEDDISCPLVLCEFRNLQKLLLWNFNLKQENLEVIKNNNLIHLELKGSISATIDKCIGSLSELEYLVLSSETMNDELLFHFLRYCTKLKSVKLNTCSQMTDRVISALSRIPTLETLILKDLEIRGDDLAMLNGLKEFRCLSCSKLQERNIIALFENAPHLQKVEVTSSSNISFEIVNAAARVSCRRSKYKGPPIIVDYCF